MASKRGVVMYYDILEQLEDFTDEQFGKITRAIIKYDQTGEIPEFDDSSLKVAFKILKPTLDRNKQEYEAICEKRREAGSLGGKQKVANASKCYQNVANLADNDNDIDKDKDNDTDIEKKESKKEKKFVKPTLDEVKSYCQERNNSVNAESFIDFYESKGWKVGKTPMKDWKACVRTWERSGSRQASNLTYMQQKNKEYAKDNRTYLERNDTELF